MSLVMSPETAMIRWGRSDVLMSVLGDEPPEESEVT